jgi:hypothetical protein
MGTEKLEALADASHGVMGDWQDMSHEIMKYMALQAAGTAKAAMDIGMAETPNAWFEAQRRFFLESWARGSAHGLKLAALSAGVAATALDPVHSRATGNAARLAGKTRPEGKKKG